MNANSQEPPLIILKTLLQVRVSDIDGAEEIISTLMGSVVEPRKVY